MRKAIVIAALLGVLAGCAREGTKLAVDRARRSLPSFKQVTPEGAWMGIDAMTAEMEQVQRDVGLPKTAATPIDFSKDTAGQAGTKEAVANTAELKAQLDAAEQIKLWLKGGLIALLGLLGPTGIYIKRLLSSVSVLKEVVSGKEKQVVSLVEATQECIHQAKTNPLSVDMIKKIQAEYQQAHGTWQSLKQDVDKVKKMWAAGEPA